VTTRPGPSREARTGRRSPAALSAFLTVSTCLLTAAVLLLAAAHPLAAQEPGDPPAGETAAEATALPSAREGPSEAPFTEERFEALQASGALILVDVYADWCPVCMVQQKVLAEFREERPDVPLHVLKVDFDEQKAWVRHFEAPRQSTLILYRGDEQLWFRVAENRRDVIFRRILMAAGGAGIR
jgi:thiol-disulfide isomerase/thioredoxin